MGDRVIVTLACTGCERRNYHYQRGKKKDVKLEMNKFCRACRKMVKHKEVKS